MSDEKLGRPVHANDRIHMLSLNYSPLKQVIFHTLESGGVLFMTSECFPPYRALRTAVRSCLNAKLMFADLSQVFIKLALDSIPGRR